MFTPFTLLLAAGVGFRLTLFWILRVRFGLDLAIPQVLAGALLVLARLPSWLQPVTFPLPVRFLLGALLADLVFSRRSQ